MSCWAPPCRLSYRQVFSTLSAVRRPRVAWSSAKVELGADPVAPASAASATSRVTRKSVSDLMDMVLQLKELWLWFELV